MCAAAVNCRVLKRETEETLEDEEQRAFNWLNKLNDEINQKKNKATIASWNYATNITDENQRINNEVSAELAKEYKVGVIFNG